MREPDRQGVARAWHIDHERYRREARHKQEWGYGDGAIGTWIVNGPYHPFWSWWYIACVHLRPIEGAPDAKKSYPEAEFEVMCMSLDPDPKDGRPKKPDVDGIEQGKDARETMPGFLQPPDWAVQFHLNGELPTDVRDRQAAQVLDRAIDHIVAGRSCDSDFREWWKNSIAATAAHYRSGDHS